MIGEESARVPLEVCGVGEIWKANPQEPFGIRQFNPNRSEDTQRFRDLYRHPLTVHNTLQPSLRPRKLDATIRRNDIDELLTFAVVDDNGEAVGLVNYFDDNARDKLREKSLIPPDALVLEVSVRKLQHDWPKYAKWIKYRSNLPDEEYKGVALSGLQQTMILVQQMEATISKEMGVEPRPVYISAYTDPKNEQIEKSLKEVGFENVAYEEYDDGPENTWLKELK